MGNCMLNKRLFGYKDEGGKFHPGKISFIKNNLTSLIRNISMDYRINLWKPLIGPLFLSLAMIYHTLSNTSKKAMQTKLRKSIKWFLGYRKIPQTKLWTASSRWTLMNGHRQNNLRQN